MGIIEREFYHWTISCGKKFEITDSKTNDKKKLEYEVDKNLYKNFFKRFWDGLDIKNYNYGLANLHKWSIQDNEEKDKVSIIIYLVCKRISRKERRREKKRM